MEAIILLDMALVVYTLIQFLKNVTDWDRTAVVTQLSAWAAGIGTALLFAGSQWGDKVDIDGLRLSDANAYSIVLIGFSVASTAMGGYDGLKAVAGRVSNKKLIPTKGP